MFTHIFSNDLQKTFWTIMRFAFTNVQLWIRQLRLQNWDFLFACKRIQHFPNFWISILLAIIVSDIYTAIVFIIPEPVNFLRSANFLIFHKHSLLWACNHSTIIIALLCFEKDIHYTRESIVQISRKGKVVHRSKLPWVVTVVLLLGVAI